MNTSQQSSHQDESSFSPEDAALNYELRVLVGPQAGASMMLPTDEDTNVGSMKARGCQVVLRDPLLDDHRLRLRVRDNMVRIKVMAGQVDIAGQVLTGPCAADWPLFSPLRVGTTVIAVGDSGSPRWADAMAWALNPEHAPALPSPEMAAAAARHSNTSLKNRQPEKWLALGGGLLAIAAFGLLALISLITPNKPEMTPQQRLARTLQAPEFAGLHADKDASGQMVVKGDLLKNADRASLDRKLAEADLSPAMDVRVAENVAAGVRDVFRMRGVPVEAKAGESLDDVGTVSVLAREGSDVRLMMATATAKRDVPGLTTLKVENEPPRIPPPVTPVSQDPGKRISSIVPGESPYVVTADGTRYFVGALLPTGHRLSAINDQQVLLSKDGQVSTLSF